jgi:hypothetical protein
MSIEKNYNIRFTAGLALREKQIQQNYRPLIAVHKWFARRPGTLFRALLLSEFGTGPVENTYYNANRFPGITIADPFMGGGTPLMEANRLGCNVIGTDINPMATWIVEEEISALDLKAYARQTESFLEQLSAEVGRFYKTHCPITGYESADVKYFLWVKTGNCEHCGKAFDLFPGYLVAEDVRHPFYVLVCPSCGDLNQVKDSHRPGACHCGTTLVANGSSSRRMPTCPHCGHVGIVPFHIAGPPKHRLFAIEYYNPRVTNRSGRLFKKPDEHDLKLIKEAEGFWSAVTPLFVPEDEIPEGDESSRLHRWGYKKFRELFNPRQLLGMEMSARIIASITNPRLRRAFATNFSDLLRYQNMLCRYDTMALKSLDIFSIHGFPVGYVQAESNLLGIRNGNALPVGSGGWINIIEKYSKAKRFCDKPFEIAFRGKKKVAIPVNGEWIGERKPTNHTLKRRVDLRCASAMTTDVLPLRLDGVFTDPPYYGMVQYGELMHFCYIWLRKLMGADFPGLQLKTTRNAQELTGNQTAARGLVHFAEGLAAAFSRWAKALKPGAPLTFTYHHNRQDAYLAVGMAVLDAGLTCSASLPCPAEMGGSIHIHGTGSSILDTVFVCRNHGHTRREWLFNAASGLAAILEREFQELRDAGMKPTTGDIRCAAYGHITRMAIWRLRSSWDQKLPTETKLSLFRDAMDALANLDSVIRLLDKSEATERPNRRLALMETN